ncbi:MAG: lipopolysaccharide biosynthesis protein [Gemmatimonadota bacterium]
MSAALSTPPPVGQRLKGEAGAILAVKVAGTGLAFLAQLLLARRLGAEGMGAYALAMAMLNALLVFGRMGFDVAALRIATLLQVDGDAAGLKGFLQVSRRIPLGVAALLSTGAAVAVHLTVSRPLVRASLLVACLGLLPWTLLRVDQGTLRALGRRVLAFLPGEIVRPGLFLLGILLAGTALTRPGAAPRAVGLHVGAITAGAVLAWALLRRTVSPAARGAAPRRETRSWVRAGVALGAVTGLNALLGQTDTLILGALLPTDQVGLFSVARRIAALLAFGLLAVNAAVAPGFARLHRDGTPEALSRLVRRAARLSTAATLPLALVLLLAGRWVLGWFGPEFPAAYPVLAILCAAQVVNAACGPVALLLSLTGHARETARVMAAGLVLLAAGVAWAAPRFGIVGAAAVSGTVLAGWNLSLVFLSRIRLGIRGSIV